MFLQLWISVYQRKKIASLLPNQFLQKCFEKKKKKFWEKYHTDLNNKKIFVRRNNFEMKNCSSSKEFQFSKERELNLFTYMETELVTDIFLSRRLLKNAISRVWYAQKLSAKLENFLGSFFPTSTPFSASVWRVP